MECWWFHCKVLDIVHKPVYTPSKQIELVHKNLSIISTKPWNKKTVTKTQKTKKVAVLYSFHFICCKKLFSLQNPFLYYTYLGHYVTRTHTYVNCILFKKQPSEVFVEKGVRKNILKFTGKQAPPATLLKKILWAGVLLWILRNF